jgi:hypothetical protein
MHNEPTDTAVAAMNEDFTDIIEGEPIRKIEVTPEEREDDELVQMPRIAFGFNRKDYGRLRQLIDRINSF